MDQQGLLQHMNRCIGFDSQGHWLSAVPISPVGLEGFTYVIHNTNTDRFYVGKKNFFFTRRLLRSGKKKKITYESDWQSYWGSSKDLMKDIEMDTLENYHGYIIDTWKTQRSLVNEEVRLQWSLDVLCSRHNGEYLYYNKFIDKTYRNDKHTEEAS